MTNGSAALARRPIAAPADRDLYGDTVVEAILTVLDARDAAAFADARATAAWCRRLAEALHLSRARTDLVVTAGLLHDVGAIATPETILFKRGPLTDAEWIVVRRHAEAGAAILAGVPILAAYAPIVRAHHELWDGSGYPRGLKGEQIPFEARVVAVADAFHAMISDRPHRLAIAQRDAMTILRDGRGTQWDATIVDAMLALLDAPRTATGRRYVAHR
jgi:HD-GYP domain-containing protein (c-di-GMP phosphodiesterase class II)